MSEALSSYALKERIVFLNEGGSVPDNFPQYDNISSNLRLVAWPLLKCNEWSNKDSSQIDAVFVNIDEIAATKPLDEWALKAWRSTFNDFVTKCVDSNLNAPELVGYTRNSNWETAVIGIQIGIRDIVKFSRISEKIERLHKKNTTESIGSNVVEFPNLNETLEKRSKNRTKIPHHAIPFPIEGLEGSSTAIDNVRSLIRRSSPLDTSIMITGETGTGKELVAKAIHKHSHRVDSPFVVVDCAAISTDLFENELFGHAKGAYTGADKEHVGLLESANGGTVFFDEVSALDPSTQVKLLRVIQEKKITPLGSSTEKELDIRVLSASSYDLSPLGEQGRFRQDLIYRLRVIEIQIPALRERKSDIPELCENILKNFARKNKKKLPVIASDAMEKLLLYAWPGNIRELENTLEHASTLCLSENRTTIHTSDLPTSFQNLSGNEKIGINLKAAVQKYERDFIARTVERLGGNKEEAAELLGLSLATLYRKLNSK